MKEGENLQTDSPSTKWNASNLASYFLKVFRIVSFYSGERDISPRDLPRKKVMKSDVSAEWYVEARQFALLTLLFLHDGAV